MARPSPFRTLLLSLAVLAGGVWPGAIHAQTGADEVVVEARRQKALERLLKTMSPSRMGRQLARWDHKVCTRIDGLEATHADFIRTRVADVADQLGIGSVRSPHCLADIEIIFTLDADALTARLLKAHPELVGEIELGAVSDKTKAPYLAPHPVRWLGQDWTKPYLLSTSSRLTVPTVQYITATVAVVDLTKLQGISWGQLADFLAFVTLSRPTFDHRYEDPGTILSLFTARDAGKPLPAGITPLDMSFLTSLYKTDQRQRAERQEQDIRVRVEHDLAKARN